MVFVFFWWKGQLPNNKLKFPSHELPLKNDIQGGGILHAA